LRKILVSVVGGRSVTADEEAVAQAVGREIAKRGAVLVCGGLGGVMEAACRGAKSAGGVTVGILPTADARDANPYVDIALATGIGFARNYLVGASTDAVVAVDGSLGTLSEVAFALDKGLPVAAIGSWELDPARLPVTARLHHATDAAEAVDWVFKSLEGLRS